MRKLALLALVIVGLYTSIPVPVQAQSAPVGERLVTPAELVYRGKFTVPGYSGLDWYNTGVMAVDGTDMLFDCADQRPAKVSILTIPANYNSAMTVKVPCTTITNIEQINVSDTNKKMIGGGAFEANGTTVLVYAYSYYDGGETQDKNVFRLRRSDLGNQLGPYRVGSGKLGMYGVYAGLIPASWRSVLGFDSLTGGCCLAIIGRSSQGPSITAFASTSVGATPTAGTMLVGYPYPNANCGHWTNSGPTTPCFTAADSMGGYMWADGTKSILFFGTHGTAANNCYGYGTLDPNLIGTKAADGEPYCRDASQGKGPHTYPYISQVWRYAAQDLLDVKNGVKTVTNLYPDLMWDFGAGTPLAGKRIRSAVYDAATKRIFITTGSMEVHVMEYVPASSGSPEVCGDGIDNDLDGLVDEGCVEICGDGIDNDSDNLIDENCTEVCGDSIDNDGDGLVDEDCDVIVDPPPPPFLTFTQDIVQCRITVVSEPPDTTGGWGVQFKWNTNNFGVPDVVAPYTRTRIFSAGTYTLLAVWSKSGQTTLTTSASTFTCQ